MNSRLSHENVHVTRNLIDGNKLLSKHTLDGMVGCTTSTGGADEVDAVAIRGAKTGGGGLGGIGAAVEAIGGTAVLFIFVSPVTVVLLLVLAFASDVNSCDELSAARITNDDTAFGSRPAAIIRSH